MIVLDSSALLAMLFFDSGGERVAEFVPQSCMTTVNLAEVLGRLARDGRPLDQVLDRLAQMGIAWAVLYQWTRDYQGAHAFPRRSRTGGGGRAALPLL